MNNNNSTIIALSIAVIILAGVVFFAPSSAVLPLGSASNNGFGGGTSKFVTASSSTATTTFSGGASGVNANRRYAQISNGGGNDVWCEFGTSTNLGVGSGIFLASSTGRLVLDGQSLYLGQIFCITRTGTSSLYIYEN